MDFSAFRKVGASFFRAYAYAATPIAVVAFPCEPLRGM